MNDELMTGDEMQPDQSQLWQLRRGHSPENRSAPLIDKLIADIQLIDSDAHMSRSKKTQRITRVAESLKKRLFEDKRRNEDDKLKASTYRRYLTLVRKAVTAQNWRHHGLEESARRLAKHYPRYAEQLHALAEMQNITELRLAHRELLNQVRQDRDLDAYDAIRRSSTTK
ncbi:hypothetical protein [Pseudomonas farris]